MRGKASDRLESPLEAIAIALLILHKNGLEDSLECVVKYGNHKTEFQVANCWALKPAPFTACNLLVVAAKAEPISEIGEKFLENVNL